MAAKSYMTHGSGRAPSKPYRSAAVDRLRVRIFATRQQMGEAAARGLTAAVSRVLAEKPVAAMLFASAPSQREVLEQLARAQVEWQRIVAFQMDEYIGLPRAAPQRFGGYLWDTLFRHVPLHSVYELDGNASDLPAECLRYARLLTDYPVDIACLGIGENGHIAFNDPGAADFNDPRLVKIITLDERSRLQQVHDGCFADISSVPHQALTLTVPALMAAQTVCCVVPGPSKAEAVYRALTDPVSPDCPASILRTHPNATLYLDMESAERLTRRSLFESDGERD